MEADPEGRGGPRKLMSTIACQKEGEDHVAAAACRTEGGEAEEPQHERMPGRDRVPLSEADDAKQRAGTPSRGRQAGRPRSRSMRGCRAETECR